MAKFNIKFSDSTYETVGELARWMDGTMADVIRESLTVFAWLVREYRQGAVLTIRRGDKSTELMIPNLERFRGAPMGDDGEESA